MASNTNRYQQQQQQFENFTASALYCEKCRAAMPVRERLLLILPDREIFDYLAKKMDLPHERILYAGDNPVPDVLGPVRAGMVAAWVNRAGARRPRKVPAPHIRVRSLTELLPLLVPDGR